MKQLHQLTDRAEQKMHYTLPNGKRLLIVTADGRIIHSYQRWPNESWEPIDPQILRFTLPGLVSETFSADTEAREITECLVA
jgi:hypothetical protein